MDHRKAVVSLGSITLPAWGWRQDDPVVAQRLAASVRRHGQLQLLVVRSHPGGGYELVNGRLVWAACKAAGLDTVLVADLGPIDTPTAQRVALDLELHGAIDYVRLAQVVSDLAGGDPDSEALAGMSVASPFTRQRLSDMVRLLRFDWSQFAESREQGGFSWDGDEPLPLALPAAAPADDTAAQQAQGAPAAAEDDVLQPEPPAPLHEPPVGATAEPDPEPHVPVPAGAGQFSLF
jgi:hypothetical protein